MKVLTVLLTGAALLCGQTAKKPAAVAAKPTAQPRTAYRAPAPKATAQRSQPIAKTAYRAQAPKSTRIQPSRIQRTPARRAVYVAPRPVVQQMPSPERYREIQQALVQKGYLQAQPTGTWDADSVAALNRFKQDQNQKADGRLDSRALIALGLGPKQENYLSTPSAIPAAAELGSQDQQ